MLKFKFTRKQVQNFCITLINDEKLRKMLVDIQESKYIPWIFLANKSTTEIPASQTVNI